MHGLDWYDYGARYYEPVLSRFTTMDPLSEKYYSISPYAYCAGNPVMFVDPDGRDYVMSIDHENNRITISANYYASTQDMSAAQQAIDYWNSQSGNFIYQTKDGGNYYVDFALTAIEVKTDASMSPREIKGALNTAFFSDISGAGNVFQIVPNSDLAGNTNGTTSGGNFIRVKDAQKTADTGAHEVGHTLGLVHSPSGLMTPASTDINRSANLNTSGLNNMIASPLNERINSERGVGAGKGSVIYMNPFITSERWYNQLNSRGKVKNRK